MQRLKQAFPALPIMLVLDGLHAAGPAMERCRNNHWQFMIVLQDGSLEQVWEEYRGLRQLLEKQDRLCNCWADRRQRFHWVNDIEYAYGTNGGTKLMVHLVICNESWQEVDSRTAEVLTRHSRHAWLSSKRLSRANVLQRCNHAARHRWDIEEGILVEKRHGYHYEHCFSYSWNAMRGYHYLMRIAHLLNVLAQHSARLVKLVEELGSRGLIDLIRQTLTGPWLEQSQVRLRLAEPFQLRLP